MNPFTSSRYGRFAATYTSMAKLYSGGQIKACKLSQLKYLQPGEHILYVGAGTGEDALAAAQAGAKVTVVELSKAMLEKLQINIEKLAPKDKKQIQLIHGDAYSTDLPNDYDAVAANFFLNVFAPDTMPLMFERLHQLLKPGGKLFIADFAPKHASWLQGTLQTLYYLGPIMAFSLLAGNAWHTLYNYQPLLTKYAYHIQASEDFRLGKIGPAWYRSIYATKPTQAE